jgi:hypothetical protein
MRKNLFLYIILLVFLTMCKKTPAVTVTPENNITTDQKADDKVYIDIRDDILSFEVKDKKPHLNIADANENKFIGYTDLSGLSPEIHIGKIYIYEKYIILEELIIHEEDKLWHDGRFCIYEYDKNLKITEYKDSGNKLYDFVNEVPYRYEGIYNDFLFIDEGSDVGIRAIHIFDLANKEEILDAAYYMTYSFNNNIVSGLVMSDSSDYDDNIKTRFYEIERGTEIPEKDYGLITRFVVEYNYNVLTKEIRLTSGKYIFEQ